MDYWENESFSEILQCRVFIEVGKVWTIQLLSVVNVLLTQIVWNSSKENCQSAIYDESFPCKKKCGHKNWENSSGFW